MRGKATRKGEGTVVQDKSGLKGFVVGVGKAFLWAGRKRPE